MSLNIQVTVDTKGITDLITKLQRASSPAALNGATKEIGLLLERNIAKRTPVKTGAAKASVQLKKHSAEEAVVVSSLNYMPGLEGGTRAHIIRPRQAKVLSWKGGGGTVFARFVHHPGTKPYHMFRDGAQETASSVLGILKKWVDL